MADKKSRAKSLDGQTFGKLTVLRRVENDRHGLARWECRCDCGNTTVITGSKISSGATKSCGCLSRIRMIDGVFATKDKSYACWRSMMKRCYNAAHHKYPIYGGRGISVCEEWRNSFDAFRIDMGARPSMDHSIDRIDNNGNYEPSNCRWATRSQQNLNQRPRKRRATALASTSADPL